MSNEVEFLKLVYDRFNAREMETVLAAMHDDVMWALMGWKAATSVDGMACAAIGRVSGR